MRKIYLSLLVLLFYCTGHAQSTILAESFEGAFPPAGWTIVNAGTGNTWTQNSTASFAYHGSKSMVYIYNSTNAANAWAFTPGLALNTNQCKITFFVKVTTASYPENLKFTVGNAATVAAQTTVLLDSANLTNTVQRRWTALYTPASAGTYYFAFNAYSAADMDGLLVDSVTITQIQNACTGTPAAGTAQANAIVACGSSPVTVSVTGSPDAPGITYQWQSSNAGANSWSDIPSATSASYTGSISVSTDFRRRTTCTNSGQSANSSVVTVGASSTPANDAPCNAAPLTLGAAAVCGNTTCATATGDPTFSASTANNTVWYTFTPAATSQYFITMSRPAGVTTGLLNAWVGFFTTSSACPSPTFTEVASSALNFDLTASPTVGKATVTLNAGTTYYLMVDGFSGSFGAYCLQIANPPAPPACATNTIPANNATNVAIYPTLDLTWSAVPNATSYDLYIGTTNPPTTVTVADITTNTVQLIGGATNTTYYWYVVPKNSGISATGCTSNVTSFTTQAPPPAPANDSCGAAIQLTSGVTANSSAVSATQSMPASTCAGFTASTPTGDVWFKFNTLAGGDATITVSNSGGNFDPVVILYSGAPTPGCAGITQVACADASGAAGIEVINATGLVPASTYYVRVYGYTASGANNFSITVTGAALPISLTDFTGVRQGNKNVLNWATASEQNNNGFELQRSANGKDFTSVAFVNSKANNGNSSSTISYEFVDVKPLGGTNYYRLKQIDKDGRWNTSKVVALKGDKVTTMQLLAVYPNPTSSVLNLLLASPVSERVSVQVTDLAGKLVKQQAYQMSTGDNNLSLDVNSIPAGTYFIKAVCANGCETTIQKFVKQ